MLQSGADGHEDWEHDDGDCSDFGSQEIKVNASHGARLAKGRFGYIACLALGFVLVWNTSTMNSADIEVPASGGDEQNKAKKHSTQDKKTESSDHSNREHVTGKDHSVDISTRNIISEQIKKEHEEWSKQLSHMTELDEYPEDRVPEVNWDWHPKDRSDRFPSVEERIQYYMGKWYNTSIPTYGIDFHKKTYVYQRTTRQYNNSAALAVNLLGLNRSALYWCYEHSKDRLKRAYCRDYIDLAILHKEGTSNIIHHVGDAIPGYRIEADKTYPVVNKVRHYCGERDPQSNKFINDVCNKDMIDCIVWPLNRHRHFGPPAQIYKYDVPWHKKKGRLIWRGGPAQNAKWRPSDKFSLMNTDMMKWKLVSKHTNSSLIDAKYALKFERDEEKYDWMPADYLLSSHTEKDEQLENKYLMSIEGNDVSSGLKWMLFSNSAVFLPPNMYESWAMEGLLEPFVHFIPVKADMSDVVEMVEWAESNPEKAQQIAERSTLFIYDLLFHPDALRDEELVLQGIMEQIEENFGYLTSSSDIHPLSHIHLGWHPQTRTERFPSVSYRTKYYMGEWFSERNVSMNRTVDLEELLSKKGVTSKVRMGAEIIADGAILSQCASGEGHISGDLRRYCQEALPDFDERITTDLKHTAKVDISGEKLAPLSSISANNGARTKLNTMKRILFDDTMKIIRFGDSNTKLRDFPVFSKARTTFGKSSAHSILWQFDYNREFGLVSSGQIEQFDIPFKSKKNIAAWRGGLGTKGEPQESSEFDHRFNLVFTSMESSQKFFDAKFRVTQKLLSQQDAYILPELMVEIESPDKSDLWQHVERMLSYRYLIATEDDYRVNFELKWMLLSQSVVFMSHELRFTSWFMEDLLEPYVHFVPIASDYSDVEKQVRWCEDNPIEAEKIAERATLFVHDMLFHRLSEKETNEIQLQIMERYAERFNGSTGSRLLHQDSSD